MIRFRSSGTSHDRHSHLWARVAGRTRLHFLVLCTFHNSTLMYTYTCHPQAAGDSFPWLRAAHMRPIRPKSPIDRVPTRNAAKREGGGEGRHCRRQEGRLLGQEGVLLCCRCLRRSRFLPRGYYCFSLLLLFPREKCNYRNAIAQMHLLYMTCIIIYRRFGCMWFCGQAL